MREVMSFRLDAKAAEAARVRATTKGKKITAYLEDLVLSDLKLGFGGVEVLQRDQRASVRIDAKSHYFIPISQGPASF